MKIKEILLGGVILAMTMMTVPLVAQKKQAKEVIQKELPGIYRKIFLLPEAEKMLLDVYKIERLITDTAVINALSIKMSDTLPSSFFARLTGQPEGDEFIRSFIKKKNQRKILMQQSFYMDGSLYDSEINSFFKGWNSKEQLNSILLLCFNIVIK